MERTYIYKIFLPAVALMMLFAGCVKDDLAVNGTDHDNEEFTFAYEVSGLESVVKTRADYEPDVRISQVDMLVYELDNFGVERFVYHRRPDVTTQSGAGTFTVRLAKSRNNEKYTYDVLFNNKTAVDNALTGTLAVGDTRDEVRTKLKSTSATFSISQGSIIPMWAGIKKEDAIVITSSTIPEPLKIIRYLAKIDIGLNLDENDVAAGLDNFTLRNVRIIYGARDGYYIPEPGNIASDGRVTGPSFEPYTVNTQPGATDTPSANATNNAIINKFYVQEQKGNYVDGNKRFSIIISGTYEDGTTQYYPIRLEDPNDPDKFLDIIRNHKYRINIKAINGKGYSTLANAAQGNAINLVYELSVTENGDINHVVYNGQNMLGVSKVYYNMDGSAGTTGEIKVLTNVGGGWSVKLTDADGNTPATNKISITPANSSSNAKGTVTFKFTDANTSEPEIYYATFTAGPLSIEVAILKNGIWYIGSDYVNGTIMYGDGDQYEINVWGNVPKLWVRAYSPDIVNIKYEREPNYKPDPNTPVSREILTFEAGVFSSEALGPKQDLEILGNAWIPMKMRQVQFQYTLTDPSLNSNVEWIPFEEGPQGKGHYRLKESGRLVALYDYEDEHGTIAFPWAVAMGIDPAYDKQAGGEYYYRTFQIPTYNFGSFLLSTGTNRNTLFYKTTHETGCGDYEEEGYPKGGWRLPAFQEMMEMYDFSEHIGDLAVYDDDYWTSTDRHVSGASYGGSMLIFLRPRDHIWFSGSNRFNYFANARCVYGDPVIEVLEQTYENWYFNPNNLPEDPTP